MYLDLEALSAPPLPAACIWTGPHSSPSAPGLQALLCLPSEVPHTPMPSRLQSPLPPQLGAGWLPGKSGPGTFDRQIKYLWAEGLSHIFLYSFIQLGNLRASSRLVGLIFLWPPEDEER